MAITTDKPAMEREVWTVQDVAEYLHLCEKTVAAKAKKKQIPGVQIGSAWRFSRDKIRNLRWAELG